LIKKCVFVFVDKHIDQNVDEANKLLSGQLEKELKDQIKTIREYGECCNLFCFINC
jgi:translation initiation factor IF-2